MKSNNKIRYNLKRLFLFFLVSLVSLNSYGFSAQPPEIPTQYSYQGFSFKPGRDCSNDWIDSSYCEATNPKSWSHEEFSIFKDNLDRISALKNFLKKIRENGFKNIFRYGSSFSFDQGTNKYLAATHAAWVWGLDHSINISDIFFTKFDQSLAFPYDVHAVVLLHELSHAFSFGENAPVIQEFNEISGWQQTTSGWQLKEYDSADIVRTFKEVQRLISEKKYKEAFYLNLSYGRQRGFPTSYSMTSPSESFAEVVAHVYFDPEVDKYLDNKLVKWVRDVILN